MLRYARKTRGYSTMPHIRIVEPEPLSLRTEAKALSIIQAEAPKARIVAAYVHVCRKKVLAGICIGTAGKMLWMDYADGRFVNPRIMSDTSHWVTADAIRNEICADANMDVFIRLIRR